MSRSFFASLQEIVREADLVIEVLDARFPELTRNPALENKIKGLGKILMICINKADLVSQQSLEQSKRGLQGLGPVVFLSAQKRQDISRLRKILKTCAHQAGKEIKVACVGYPNVGKSSLINALTGKHSAPTSTRSGFTRGKQFIRLDTKVLLVDSPGIIPFDQEDEFLLTLISAKSSDNIQDAEGVAVQLIEFIQTRDKRALGHAFSVTLSPGTATDILAELGIMKKKLQKNGEPDLDAIARQVIAKWQQGKILSA